MRPGRSAAWKNSFTLMLLRAAGLGSFAWPRLGRAAFRRAAPGAAAAAAEPSAGPSASVSASSAGQPQDGQDVGLRAGSRASGLRGGAARHGRPLLLVTGDAAHHGAHDLVLVCLRDAGASPPRRC